MNEENEKGISGFHRFLIRAERLVDRVKGPEEVGMQTVVQCYYGYGNGKEVVVRGRVVQGKKLRESLSADSWRQNFFVMASQFFTAELPYAQVAGEVCGTKFAATCDEEGYFTQKVTLECLPDVDTLWVPYHVSPLKEGGVLGQFEGRIQMLPNTAQRMIISDIDDTVIETGAAKLWQMLKTTLFENVHSRRVFPGVSEFYLKLHLGLSGADQNPLFYVSSSPWNLRAFIMSVFEKRGIPMGPAFMTDWGIDETKILKHSHGKHKLNAIKSLLDFYPEQSVILIGDSGEKDPEIYTEVVQQFDGRIEAIYIRDVSGDIRDAEVHELAKTCVKHHVPLLLTETTDEAAADAERLGFIK